MHHQMQAERTRRAVVTEAPGAREAAITRAEGEKQAAILEADGRGQAIERIANAERYRQTTVAEGEAAAVRTVFGAIHDGRPDAGRARAQVPRGAARDGGGQATKIFLPTEMSGLFGAVGGLAELLRRDDNGEVPKGEVPKGEVPTGEMPSAP